MVVVAVCRTMAWVCHMMPFLICLAEVCVPTHIPTPSLSTTVTHTYTHNTLSLGGGIVDAVLAGSKYGVRQTRGKFGLGAKMVR